MNFARKRRQELAYPARPLVPCGLSLRRTPASELVHRRQIGKFFLEAVANPCFGSPFGEGRPPAAFYSFFSTHSPPKTFYQEPIRAWPSSGCSPQLAEHHSEAEAERSYSFSYSLTKIAKL